MKRLFALALPLLFTGATALAQPPAPAAAPPSAVAPQADPDAWIDRFIQLNVVPHLRVNAAHAEPVRTAAVAMVSEHLPRVRTLMLRWLAEERVAPSPELASDRTLARLYNEFGLWSLDSAGPAHDAVVLQALANEQACHPLAEPVTEMDQRLGRLRSLPAPELLRALAFERELLARWGSDRKLPVATPFPVADTIQRLRSGQATGHPPLPALLNAYVADAKGGQRREVARARATDRCLLQHWSLRAALATASDDTARAAALARWREGTAIRLPELLWMSREAAGASPAGTEGYPELAKRFGLAGTVTLSVDLDAKGQLQRSTVLSRQLSVPGIPEGVRPVVFETLLDDATQGRARSQTYKAPAERQLVNGVLTASQAFIWKLE
jgi:hypothetical protein